MAVSDRLRCYAAIHETGVVPLFYEPAPEAAGRLAAACVEGGARVVELTDRGPGALAAFAAVVGRLRDSDVWIGAGSIMDAPTAAHYLSAGARFIVSPSLDEATARLCNRRKVPYIPGCMTPGEIGRAEELGAEIVKVFPGTVGGPEFVRAVRGPMPWTSILPTGGVAVSAESIGAWLGAGACAVGIGSALFPEADRRQAAYGRIADRVAAALSFVRSARGNHSHRMR